MLSPYNYDYLSPDKTDILNIALDTQSDPVLLLYFRD